MPENIQMICLVRLIVSGAEGSGTHERRRFATHDGFARCGTDDAGLLVWFSAYRGAAVLRLTFRWRLSRA